MELGECGLVAAGHTAEQFAVGDLRPIVVHIFGRSRTGPDRYSPPPPRPLHLATPPTEPQFTSAPASNDERRLVAALRVGDEAAFAELLDTYASSMLRVAKHYVGSHAIAEDVVQETWLRIIGAIDSFEGRSSLRTWIFVILGNCARKRAEREGRYVALASEPVEPSVDPGRFFPGEHPRWGGMWTTLVDGWENLPDEILMSTEARERITEAIEALPPNYATVFTLRDVEGWQGSDVCALLGITAENQRVLLHRARGRIRTALEEYFAEGTT